MEDSRPAMVPSSSLGIAFLSKGDRRTLAEVRSFDGHRYVFALYRPPTREGSTDQEEESCIVDLDHQDGNDGWHNASLPNCCVCLTDTADRFLRCHCTVPCVCTTCAKRIRACPMCRERVQGWTKCEDFLDAYEARAPDALKDPGDATMWGETMRSRFPRIHAVEFPFHDAARAEIFIRSLAGKTYALVVHLQWSVCMVKTMICYREGIHPKEQRLIFAGKQLEDKRALLDYAICEGNTLVLTLRLCGD